MDQDALEYAVLKGWVGLAYDLDVDRMTLLGKMQDIRKAYAEVIRQNTEELMDSYQPLMDQIRKEAA